MRHSNAIGQTVARLAISGIIFLLIAKPTAFAQGFINLGFESARLVPIPEDPYNRVQFDQAFPGWTATVGGIPVTRVLTNSVFLDTAGIAIINRSWTNFAFIPGGLIEGRYTAILMSGSLTNTFNGVDTTISQTSLVPIGMQSLLFKANTVYDSSSSFAVTLGGQTLSLMILATDPNYTLYGADASAWAGLTVPLTFTVFGETPHQYNVYFYLDSIQFSASAIPEPSTIAVGALGALLFGVRRGRVFIHQTKRPGGAPWQTRRSAPPKIIRR